MRSAKTENDAVSKQKAWDYALGMIKVDGLQPSQEFLNLVEKEKRGLITLQEMEEILYSGDYIEKSTYRQLTNS